MCRVRRRTPLLALAALTLTACGSGGAAAPPATRSTVEGVGDLPAELAVPETTATATTDATDATPETDPSTSIDASTTTTTVRPRSNSGSIGRIAEGNQLLVIGDSILAGTAERYSGLMCWTLVPMGWAVEVDAETGQPIDFGLEVLTRRGRAGWDAAVIQLGTNYNSDAAGFEAKLRQILDQLREIPVMLLTVTPYEERLNEVNYIIRVLAEEYENVRVVDWGGRTEDDDSLLRGDGIHPSDEGQEVLVQMIARGLGRAPSEADADAEPECLPTRFTDDSLN
jgi:hypothetical protein